MADREAKMRDRCMGWVLLALVAAAGCSAPPPPDPGAAAPASPPPVTVGGDRDAHGCIPSAGYRWCARSARCERPWELAQAEGFENTAEGFDRHCATPR